MQGSIPGGGGGGGIISNDRGKVCPVSLSLSRYVWGWKGEGWGVESSWWGEYELGLKYCKVKKSLTSFELGQESDVSVNRCS